MVLGAVLEEGMSEYLGKARGVKTPGGVGSVCNGGTSKTVISGAVGSVLIEVLCDRNGSFEPVIVKKC